MNGVAWAERPEHPRARNLPVPRVEHPNAPPWAGRAVLGIALVGDFIVIGSPLGLGLTAVLLALGAVAAKGRRPVIPVEVLRSHPAGPDAWRSVWWVLAGALALIPVLRAASWVVVPCVLVAAALA